MSWSGGAKEISETFFGNFFSTNSYRTDEREKGKERKKRQRC